VGHNAGAGDRLYPQWIGTAGCTWTIMCSLNWPATLVKLAASATAAQPSQTPVHSYARTDVNSLHKALCGEFSRPAAASRVTRQHRLAEHDVGIKPRCSANESTCPTLSSLL
jgi:hypothetical protein